MRETVKRLWPEIDWIQDPQLREQVTQTWIRALERSPLQPDDLNQIPFTLLVPNCPITFMEPYSTRFGRLDDARPERLASSTIQKSYFTVSVKCTGPSVEVLAEMVTVPVVAPVV